MALFDDLRAENQALRGRVAAPEAIAPFEVTGVPRCRLEGPPVRIAPQVAAALALARRKLATNAAKVHRGVLDLG